MKDNLEISGKWFEPNQSLSKQFKEMTNLYQMDSLRHLMVRNSIDFNPDNHL